LLNRGSTCDVLLDVLILGYGEEVALVELNDGTSIDDALLGVDKSYDDALSNGEELGYGESALVELINGGSNDDVLLKVGATEDDALNSGDELGYTEVTLLEFIDGNGL